MTDEPDSGLWLSPKFWFVLTLMLFLPLGTSFALYGAREARLIRAANVLAQEVESPSIPESVEWNGAKWVEHLTQTVPELYQIGIEGDPDGRKSPFEGVSVVKRPPTKTWQIVVSADDELQSIFFDVYGPNSDQPFYTREVHFHRTASTENPLPDVESQNG